MSGVAMWVFVGIMVVLAVCLLVDEVGEEKRRHAQRKRIAQRNAASEPQPDRFLRVVRENSGGTPC